MTKKSNKKEHREIVDRLEEKPTPENKKTREDFVYGDENNSSEKYGTGTK